MTLNITPQAKLKFAAIGDRVMWSMLLLYAVARPFQFFQATIPVLASAMHVLPPAVFAAIHSARTYGWKGCLVFASLCLGTAALFESVSLRTGVPFGHYYFTSAMGPKVAQLPVLLALAYWGIGYCAWCVSVAILNKRPGRIAVPLLASFIMLAWDLSMEAIWADLGKAWVWLDGGPYFGVPLSNFAGWLITAYVYYQAFAIYLKTRPTPPQSPEQWRLPIAFYAVCALGNAILAIPIKSVTHLPYIVADATGRVWNVNHILQGGALVSLAVMLPLAMMACYSSRSIAIGSNRDARTAGQTHAVAPQKPRTIVDQINVSAS